MCQNKTTLPFKGLNCKSTSYKMFYRWIRNFSMNQIFILILLNFFFSMDAWFLSENQIKLTFNEIFSFEMALINNFEKNWKIKSILSWLLFKRILNNISWHASQSTTTAFFTIPMVCKLQKKPKFQLTNHIFWEN